MYRFKSSSDTIKSTRRNDYTASGFETVTRRVPLRDQVAANKRADK